MLLSDYATMPFEMWTARDLTDALGIEASAIALNTSKRSIYTIRNTNVLSLERRELLASVIKQDERTGRRLLVGKLYRRAQAKAAQTMDDLARATQHAQLNDDYLAALNKLN